MKKSLLVAVAIVFGSTAWAEDVTGPVRYATAEWLNFTNQDGTGLYHELLREIFGDADLDVEVSYMPLNRAVSMVGSGEMDLTGGFTKDDRLFANHPIYETTYSVLYPADSGFDWDDPASLEGLRIVGPPKLGAEVDFQMTELESRSQAARMVLTGRADAFMDLHELLEDFVETGTVVDVDQVSGDNAVLDVNPSDWKITQVGASRLYMLFSDSERGRTLRNLYDSGTEALYLSGRLDEIYGQYDIQTPKIVPQ